MIDRGILILGAREVAGALDGREPEVIEAVSRAYVSHRRGHSNLPHSVFLRFADDDPNRIIGLPAYLADEEPIAGLKWIASFPGNTARGIDRASAVLVLNSLSTGRPIAVMESSIISARRTAASAALAAKTLHAKHETRVGLIGCGLINFEVLRFLRICFPLLEHVALFDLDPVAAQRFVRRVDRELPGLVCRSLASTEQVFADARLVSLATVAGTPHIESLAGLSADSTVLHLSLRDLAPAVMRAVDNIVDDIDHVLRARTSLHLTELEDGNREFVRCPLADVLSGDAPARIEGRPTVFSPFGLGILDLAVARLVLDHARSVGAGVEVHGFLPESRAERVEYRKLNERFDPAPLVEFVAKQGRPDHLSCVGEASGEHIRALCTGETDVWTASVDGELAGLVSLSRGTRWLGHRVAGERDDGSTAELVEILVHSDHRGMGIGAGLVERVRQHVLRRREITALYAIRHADDEDRRRWFLAIGLVEVESFDDELRSRRTTLMRYRRSD